MKPLIAIFSCAADIRNGRNQAIRETWSKEASEYFDVKFFIGTTPEPILLETDEIQLPAYDGGDNLVEKDQAIMQWAIQRDYQRILKTETDVYISGREMSHYDYNSHDVIAAWVGTPGERYSGSNRYSFPQGHAIWYSRKAALFIAYELVATALFEMKDSIGETVNHTLRSGDMWSGQVLHKHIKELTFKNDITNFGNGPLTWHCPSSRKEFVPKWLKEMKYRGENGLL